MRRYLHTTAIRVIRSTTTQRYTTANKSPLKVRSYYMIIPPTIKIFFSITIIIRYSHRNSSGYEIKILFYYDYGVRNTTTEKIVHYGTEYGRK